MNLQELKRKYSGQAIPEWELKQADAAQPAQKKKPKPAPAHPADEMPTE